MSNLDDLTAIILAGGKGTRLQSIINDRPKVMAPVNQTPFLFILLDNLIQLGIKNIIFSIGYKSEYIRQVVGISYKGQKISYSEETKPLGTAGAIALASSRYKSKHYLIMNGDSYVEYSFKSFFDFYLTKSSDAVILVKKVEDAQRYGAVEFNKQNKVESFKEKRKGFKPAFINCGVYLLRSSILSFLPRKTPSSLEHDFFPKIVSKNFYAFETEGRHLDIGTPESYKLAQTFF